MRRWGVFMVCVMSLAGPVGVVEAGQLVREFSGSRSMVTADFEVESPWLIDWRVRSEYYQSMGIAIELINAADGTHAGRVVKTKRPGNGLRLMNQSGRYRFRVDSSLAEWNIKVEQLDEAEAARYSPKNDTGF
jgi:hypothetical protein